jgi:hypothetical protein
MASSNHTINAKSPLHAGFFVTAAYHQAAYARQSGFLTAPPIFFLQMNPVPAYNTAYPAVLICK